jgi:hypothetical protein
MGTIALVRLLSDFVSSVPADHGCLLAVMGVDRTVFRGELYSGSRRVEAVARGAVKPNRQPPNQGFHRNDG